MQMADEDYLTRSWTDWSRLAERDFRKIELIRNTDPHPSRRRRPPRYPHDPWVIAVASDAPLPTELPQLDINDPPGVADFIRQQMRAPNCSSAALRSR